MDFSLKCFILVYSTCPQAPLKTQQFSDLWPCLFLFFFFLFSSFQSYLFFLFGEGGNETNENF